MPYLIDGHNLIPKIPDMSLKTIDDEEHLIQLLQDFCRQQQKDIEVFFDKAPAGYARTQKLGRLTVHFVRQGRSADSAIRERLQKIGGAARNWTVVSSDHAVQTYARQARAQIIDSEDFSKLLRQGSRVENTDTDRPEYHSSPEEVDEWLETFQPKPKRQQ
jgi:uncharacterized protein